MTGGDIGVLLFLGAHLWLLWVIAKHVGRIADYLTFDDEMWDRSPGHVPPMPATKPPPEEPCCKS